MQVTVKQIAGAAGVAVPTAYEALRGGGRLSDATRRRVEEAAQRLGWQPNAAARALVTKRTGNLGLILSDRATGGWVNPYYASQLMAVTEACRRRGYGLHVSLYNLWNIDEFIVPSHVGQRVVDAVVFSGWVQTEVAARFHAMGIPCVSIGNNMDVAQLIPAVACDMAGGLAGAFHHLAEAGHRSIGIYMGEGPRMEAIIRDAEARRAHDPAASRCRVVTFDVGDQPYDHTAVPALIAQWQAMPPAQRPTALISSDQIMMGVLGALHELGLSCPRDVSLVASCDSLLCELTVPSISAINQNIPRLGQSAVDLLVDHLERNDEGGLEPHSLTYPCKVVARGSTAGPKAIGD